MIDEQFDRSVRFFGREGQQALEQSSVLFAGAGGLGSAAAQHGALLHIGHMTFADPGHFKKSNRNRYVTGRHSDAIPGTRKVDIARRLVETINPTIQVDTIFGSVISEEGFAAIKAADVVVGGLDNSGSRLLLLQACAALGTPYMDMATEIIPGQDKLRYGGRVCFSFFGNGCLSCLDVLDREEARRDLATDDERDQREALYGVDQSFLADSGPSVAPLNGVVASAGMFELMAYLTGLRAPQTHLNYNGETGKIAVRSMRRDDNCYFCNGLFPGTLQYDVNELLLCGGNENSTLQIRA